MPTHYTSFQIKNTAAVPMFITIKDPDGNEPTFGPLDPGQTSIQLAPIGTRWTITFAASAAPENIKSPEADHQSSLEGDEGDKDEDELGASSIRP